MSGCCDGKRCRLGVDDPRHGTENGYNNLHCRCRSCRNAHAEYYRESAGGRMMAKYRAKLLAQGLTLSGRKERVRPYRERPQVRGRRGPW